MAYRERFGRDVVIDVIGYRRHGHNEGDEPAYTQPQMYERIREHPPLARIVADRLIAADAMTEEEVEGMREHIAGRLRQEYAAVKAHTATPDERPVARTADAWAADTRVPAARLRELQETLLTWPDGFEPNPKLAQQLDRRRASVAEGTGIDWGTAETLAYASLLTEGVHVRLTGQDSERGTFSHRHAVIHEDAHRREAHAARRAAVRQGGIRDPRLPARARRPASASSTATPSRHPTRSCCGRRSTATSRTAPRS